MKICIIGDPRSPNLRELVNSLFTDSDTVILVSQFSSPSIKSCRLNSIFGTASIFSKSLPGGNVEPARGFISYLLRKLPISSAATSIAYILQQWLRILELPLQIYQVKKILRQHTPDIVLAYRTQVEGYLGAFAAPCRFLLFTQGSDFEYFALRDPLHFFLTRYALNMSCGVIVDASRDLFNIHRVSPACNQPRLISLGNGGISLPSISKETLYSRSLSILCIRPPAPYIDHLTLFKAIHILRSRCGVPAFTFSLIAQPDFHDQLSAQSARAGLNPQDITFIPFLEKDDYHQLLSVASIVVSPSKTDGIPISLIEAMAFGCFPVASDILSVHDIILNGINGLVYTPGDSLGLSSVLFRALIDAELRSQAFSYSRRFILNGYSKGVVTPLLRSFMESQSSSIGSKYSS